MIETRDRQPRPIWAAGLHSANIVKAFDYVFGAIPFSVRVKLEALKPAMLEVAPGDRRLNGVPAKLRTRVDEEGELVLIVLIASNLSYTQAVFHFAHEFAHLDSNLPQLFALTGMQTTGEISDIFISAEEHLTNAAVYFWGFAGEMRSLVRTGQIPVPGWWVRQGESGTVTGQPREIETEGGAIFTPVGMVKV
jgi:hypothetical protein